MNDFDAKASTWDSDPGRIDRARAVATAIRASVPLTAKMTGFEFGCGTGLLSFALHPYLAAITLADSSEGMLGVLREKIASSGVRNMTPVRLDLAAEPAPRERFDITYSLMVLHHVPDTDDILAKFHTLLKSGGYLCIADLDKEDGSFHGPDAPVHKGFERAGLAARLAKAGFGNTSFSTVYRQKKDADHGPKVFPLFLAIAQRE